MVFFQKPENALKRAQELKDVGKPELALEVLQELITSRRHRSWTKVHEQIMIEYINLCIDTRKGRNVRDGLHQYKNIVASTNLQSLEVVVRHYIKAAEEKVESARGVVEKVVLDFEDLEASETPESLLMMMVSEEDQKDRTDRQVLTPWLKFLWEAYRTVLDILRNNARLEGLYQSIAQLALQFCLKYERKPEFHRLCDLLRYHLQQVMKYQGQVHSINLNSQESLNAHLQTRFVQLDVAGKLELWQEAFKAIEEISLLMGVSSKSPKPQMLADYYSKLAAVFWRSQQLVYTAASLLKLFQLSKEQKKSFSADEARALASSVLLAVLSCPLQSTAETPVAGTQVNDMGVRETAADRTQSLMNLLGVDAVPTREGLVQEMNAANILHYVEPELRNLYSLVERQFAPLDLCRKVQPILEFIGRHESLAHYIEPLQSVVTLRLLKQLSQVYSTMKMARLSQLIHFYNEIQIEQFIVRAVKKRTLQMRLCHRTRSLHFATNVFVAEAEAASGEGPQLQLLQSQMMTSQLTTVGRRLREAASMIDPTAVEAATAARRASVYDGIMARVRAEHRAALERKAIIESHKEKTEKEANHLLEIERIQREEEARLRREEDERRAREAEIRRAQEDAANLRKLQNRESLLSVLKTAAGQKLLEHYSMEELESKTPDQILALQIELLDKERREQTAKFRTQEKRVDYFERAKQKEEAPLRKAAWEKHQEEFKRQYLEQQAAQAAQEAKAHQEALQRRERYRPMAAHQALFAKSVLARRQAALDVQMVAYNQLKAQHDEVRRQQEEAARERQRQEEEARRLQEEQEEEERRQKEAAEEEARQRAEEARLKKEEREQKEKEEREAAEKKKAASAAPPARKSTYVPPAARQSAEHGGGDRGDRGGYEGGDRGGDRGGYGGGGRSYGRDGGYSGGGDRSYGGDRGVERSISAGDRGVGRSYSGGGDRGAERSYSSGERAGYNVERTSSGGDRGDRGGYSGGGDRGSYSGGGERRYGGDRGYGGGGGDRGGSSYGGGDRGGERGGSSYGGGERGGSSYGGGDRGSDRGSYGGGERRYGDRPRDGEGWRK